MLDDMEFKELDKVNAALKRIEDGNYGECEKCGDDIAENRLKAVPFATTCINCAK